MTQYETLKKMLYLIFTTIYYIQNYLETRWNAIKINQNFIYTSKTKYFYIPM